KCIERAAQDPPPVPCGDDDGEVTRFVFRHAARTRRVAIRSVRAGSGTQVSPARLRGSDGSPLVLRTSGCRAMCRVMLHARTSPCRAKTWEGLRMKVARRR